MFPPRSWPPSAGPAFTVISKESFLPGSPLSAAFTVKVHGAPLLVQVPPKLAVLSADREGRERHAVHVCPAGMVDVLQVTVDRRARRVALYVEAEGADAAREADGAAPGDLACGLRRRNDRLGQLEDVGVGHSAVRGLEGAGRGREVGRGCHAGRVRVARGVQRDAESVVVRIPAEVGGIQKRGASGVELRYDGVSNAAAERGLERSRGEREIERAGAAGDEGVAGGIHGDGAALIIRAPTEIGGIQKRRASGVEFL
jgi:hypothetical protein